MMRNYLIALAVTAAAVFGLMFVSPPKASALPVCVSNGYFTNVGGGDCSGPSIWCGLLESGCNPDPHDAHLENYLTKATFIQHIYDELYKADANPGDVNLIQQSVGAAYIIDHSLGVGYQGFTAGQWGNYVADAKANYNEWASRVRSSRIGIAYQNVDYDYNTAFTRGHNYFDIVKYGDNDTRAAVILYDTSVYPNGLALQCTYTAPGHFCGQYRGVYMLIKADCGNPVGTIYTLPNNNPPIGHYDTMTCDGGTGWGFDPDDSADKIIFQVYINGTFAGQNYTNVSRPDVNAAYGITGTHGWLVGPLKSFSQFNYYGSNTVTIYLIDNQDNTVKVNIGTKTVGPCDHAPTADMTISCTPSVGITVDNATDLDYNSGGRMRIEVFQGAPITDPGTYRVFGGFTTAGHLSIPWLSSSGDNVDMEHAYDDPLDPDHRSTTAATYPSWDPQSLWVYVVDRHLDGSDHFRLDEAYIFDGDTTVNGTGIDDDGAHHYDQAGPCAKISCSVSTLGTSLAKDSSNDFTVAVKVQNTGTDLPPSPVPGFNVTIENAAGVAQALTPDDTPAYDPPPKSSPTKIVSKTLNFKPTAVGDYTISWSWDDPGHTNTNTATGATPCGGAAVPPISVNTQPYFNVSGGDIAAGLQYKDSSGACTTVTAVKLRQTYIKSWNVDGVGGSYHGAGTQFAALATGAIKSFITNSDLGSGVSNVGTLTVTPHDLAFANSSFSAGSPASVDDSGNYGGGLDSFPAGACATDSYDDNYKPTTTNPASSGGTYSINDATETRYFSGNITLSSNAAVKTGHNQILVVKGSVYIDDNIIYGYGSAATIPSVTIYARDGIYIDKDVTELHGTFVAQGLTGGTVFATCANAMKSEITVNNKCDSPLNIYGSVSAQTVHLDRTQGNYQTTTSGPAEQFHYTPEIWLPLTTGPQCTADCPYNSISGLPPVL